MFHSIRPEDLSENAFRLIGRDWLLLTATRTDGASNCMTASWGGLGVLWGKPVLYCFIRPQRYTHGFTEDGDRLSACVFPEEYRRVLAYCGRESGRDGDKAKACNLTPVCSENGAVYYEEARLVILGRKLYAGKIDPACFTDPTLDAEAYPQKDYHTVYVYEIEQILQAD